MSFLEFRNAMFELACFNTNQVYAWYPNFDSNNLTRWLKKGLLIKLRQSYYTFPEYLKFPDFASYFANRIYQPSYISLHSGLSFYGMIPESVTQITSVTTLKTFSFTNVFGEYSYKTINPSLFFGYDLKPLPDGRALQIAQPEKALLDLLYLYPFYDSENEFSDLRLDDDYLSTDFDKNLFLEYAGQFKNKSLDKRVSMLIKTYNL